MTRVKAKWRPSMALVIMIVCLVLVSVPIIAFLILRLSSNQFVRETEHSLINQAAIYATAYAHAFEAQGGDNPGTEVAAAQRDFWAETLHPWQPVLNLRTTDVLPPLPDLEDIEANTIPAPDPRYKAIAPAILDLAQTARGTTLTGALFLDHRGTNIRADHRQSFATAAEVQAALSGKVGAALRDRGGEYDRHPLTSISRDTWYRVFVAYPVIVENRVIGVVYLSRTPSNFAKFVLNEWPAILSMLVATLLTAALIGWLLLRLFSRPIRSLSAQGKDITTGQISEVPPLEHYGVREVAELGDNIIRMSKTLNDRSRQIRAYTDHVTHELKSPVTAILGAAELLSSEDLTDESRQKLQANIETQARRMNRLLEKLREMTRLRDAPTIGSAPLKEMLPDIPSLQVSISAESDKELPLLAEHGRIVLHQLAQNAAENGAGLLEISYRQGVLTVQDDGDGIAPENRDQIATPFFTTRRDEGGTGLGLAIVSAILQNYDADMTFEPVDNGACVQIAFGGQGQG